MSTEDHLTRVVDALSEEFAGVFSRDTVASCVHDSHQLLTPARVQSYVPVLAHRFSRERLRAIAVTQKVLPASHPRVLFVCTHNAGRSQLAAALLQHAAQGRVEVASAGTAPATDVDPTVLQALAEIGMDATGAYTKPLTSELVEAADVVVTMGCGDACPVFPVRRYLDWDLADPAGADLPRVRAIRDQIAAHVEELLAELPNGAVTR